MMIFSSKARQRLLIGLAMVISLAAPAILQRGARSTPLPLHTSGNQIYNSMGSVVVLKGVDIPSMEWTNTGDHLIQSVNEAITKWHVSLIRLPISQDRWEGYMGQSDGGAGYRQLVDQVVSIASAAGVYVLVDDHWSDMGVWGSNVTQHEMPDDNSTKAWNDIAGHYANNPAVLFDAYNEPHDVSWDIWQNGGMVTDSGATYHSPGMQGLVNTIRATGAKNIITVGGLGYSSDLTGVARGRYITGSNIVYSCHFYPSSPPDWDTQVAGVDKSAPIYVGEFGADPTAPYAAFMPKILSWIDQHRYSATAWCMHPAATPVIITDWNYTPSFADGTYVYSWLAGGPPAPSALQASGGVGTINLTWTAQNATTYVVYRSKVPGQEGSAAPLATGVHGTSYADSSLSNGDTYYYQISAVNSAAISGPSNEIGATAGIAGGFIAPVPDFTLTATAVQGSVHQPLAIQVTASNTSKANGTGILIDMEIHDSHGVKVNQQTTVIPSIPAGNNGLYTFSWTPSAPGTYTVDIGAFGSGWAPKYDWNNSGGTLNVTGN